MRTGAQLVQDFVATNGVRYVFGNPGTTETTFLAALAGSQAEYVLGLNEPTVVGVAAGYALATGETAVVSLHTYPGLASGMFNLKNAHDCGIPMLVVNGTQDSRFLIHDPPLGGPNTTLAETATKYQYECRSVDEVALALQRGFVQAGLQPTGPVFLSIPMDFMQARTARSSFRRTRVLADTAPASVGDVVAALRSFAPGRLGIVSDYAVGRAGAVRAVTHIADALGADVWSAPFHVQGVGEPLHPSFKGQLPLDTAGMRAVLEHYDGILILGDKLTTFTWSGIPAVPEHLQIIHVTPATAQLGFDWPADLAVVGDVRTTMDAVARELGLDPDAPVTGHAAPDPAALEARFPASGPNASAAKVVGLMAAVDVDTHVVTEGSSEEGIIQAAVRALGHGNVHFSPRGGGLGWAMPLAVGLALGSGRPTVAFAGDGGSLFSIHAIWTAASLRLPVTFVLFVNDEYRLLKDLWVSVLGGSGAATRFVGLDFDAPALDLRKIAEGFGARVFEVPSAAGARDVMAAAMRHQGPSAGFVDRER